MRQGIDWAAAGVPAGAAPSGVLQFLATAAVDDCCRMLTEWAADGGCPGIVAFQNPLPAVESPQAQRSASGGTRRSSPLAPRGSDCVPRRAERAAVSTREVLRRVLARFAADFFGDLETLQQV